MGTELGHIIRWFQRGAHHRNLTLGFDFGVKSLRLEVNKGIGRREEKGAISGFVAVTTKPRH